MRIALISDIHGNWDGFEAVLRDIESRHVDKIICLGDLVEGGDRNDAVVEFIKNNNIATVRGNHDEINDCSLKQDNHILIELAIDKNLQLGIVIQISGCNSTW